MVELEEANKQIIDASVQLTPDSTTVVGGSKEDGTSPFVFLVEGYVNEVATGLDAPIITKANNNETNLSETLKFRGEVDLSSGMAPTTTSGQSEYWLVTKGGTITWGTTFEAKAGDKLIHYYDNSFDKILGVKHFDKTHWSSTDETVESIANGSSVDIFDFISDTDKLPVSTIGNGALSVVNGVIKTDWQDTIETLNIRVTLELDQRGTDYYRLILKRASDNSIISVHPVNINSVDVPEETVTTNITTYVSSETDTYITDGFYIEFANDSGASVDMKRNVNVNLDRVYQIPVQRNE